MLAVQLADAARLDPQLVEVTAKSAGFAPEIDPEPRVTEFAVLFETVMVCEALVEPALTLPKDRLLGIAVTLVVPVPVPERATESRVEPAAMVQAAV